MTVSPRRRLYRSAVLVVSTAILLGLVAVTGQLLFSGQLSIKQGDFIAYYSASHLVDRGQGAHVYDTRRLAPVEIQTIRPYRLRYGSLPYVNPPFFAALLSPIALLPYSSAYLVWLLVNLAILSFILWCLFRYSNLRKKDGLLFVTACLSYFPLWVAFLQGQSSVFVLLCLAGAAMFALRDRWILTGCSLAFVLVKPPYVVPFLLVLLASRRWRALASFLATALVLFLAPTFVMGRDINTSYAGMLLQAASWRSQFGYGPRVNQSVFGWMELLLGMGVGKLVASGLAVLALAGLALLAWRSIPVDLAFSMAAVTALFVSPHVLIHDLTILVLAAVVAVRYRGERPYALDVILIAGYAAGILALEVAAHVPLQLTVLCSVTLGGWLAARSLAESAAAKPPSHVPLPSSLARAGVGS